MNVSLPILSPKNGKICYSRTDFSSVLDMVSINYIVVAFLLDEILCQNFVVGKIDETTGKCLEFIAKF